MTEGQPEFRAHRTQHVREELEMDSDDSSLHTRPTYECYARHPSAVRDLIEEMMKILTEPEYSFTSAADREIVRDVTGKRCYVGLDCDTEFETDELPDGNIIVVFTKCFRCVKCYPSQVSLASGFH